MAKLQNTSSLPVAKGKNGLLEPNNDARDLKIPLSFLTPGKKYEASIYYDDLNSKVRTRVSIKLVRADAATVMDTKLIASGGQAIWIRPFFKN